MRYLTKKTVLNYIENDKLNELIDNCAATIDGGYIFYYESDKVVKVDSAETFKDWLLCILGDAGWDYYWDNFVYYSDAFEYLQNNNITDIKDAIDEGYTDIVSIANYYYYQHSMEEIDDAAAELMKSYNDIANDWLND